MKAFDERAEAAAEREGGRGDGGGPSGAEKRAVRRALATGGKKLEDDLSSLDVLLCLNPNNPNAPVEQGPPQPGTRANQEAVDFFGRVAADLRKIRDAVSAVDFDPDDKKKFRAAFKEMAAAWELRGQALASTDPAVTTATLNAAWEHEQRAATSKRGLRPYFPDFES